LGIFPFVGMQLPITFIAKELSLTVDSVRYAVKKYGLKYSHADITDEELDIIVTSILEKWPTTGDLQLIDYDKEIFSVS
jgi:hypothetical protein